MLDFEYFHLGDGIGVLVLMVEDVSGFVWLEPEYVCAAAAISRAD